MTDRRNFLKAAAFISAAASTGAIADTDPSPAAVTPASTSEQAPMSLPEIAVPPNPEVKSFTGDRIGGESTTRLLGAMHPDNLRDAKTALAKALDDAARPRMCWGTSSVTWLSMVMISTPRPMPVMKRHRMTPSGDV